MITFRRAVLLVVIFTLLGALLQGQHVMRTIGKGIVGTELNTTAVVVALICSGIFVTLATFYRIPTSTSQAIVGGVMGIGMATGAPIDYAKVITIAQSWVLCPLLVLGFLLPLGWSAARNTRLADQFMVFPVSVGVFFRAGNNEIAFQELSGIFSLPPEERQAAEGYKWSKLYAQMKSGEEEMTPREVSSFWWGQGWLPWKKDPRRGVLLFWKKALLAFTANEIPIVQDMEFEKRFMSLFRWPLPSMGWLLPLTSAGLVWRVRERKHLLPLLLAVSQCAMLGLFFVNSRQRLPLVVGLLPLAGAAIATVPDWIRKSRWNVLTAGAVAAVGGLLLTTAFEPPDAAERLDFMANRSAAACLEKGDYEGAVELFREVLDSQEEPNPMTLNNAAYVMAERYDKTGEGDLSEAISLARQALKETKGSPMAADTLIWLLLLDFQTDEAGRMLGAFMHRFPSYRQFYLRWAYMQMLSCNFEAAKNTIRDLVSKGSPELREEGRLLLEEVVERERLMNESPTGGDE